MKTNIFGKLWTSLVLLCLSTAPLSAEQFGLFTYLVEGDSIAITDYPEDAIGEAVIPAEIDGKPVTRIMYGAFSGCSALTSVTIPNSVTEIGSRAFEDCSSLTSITIPDNFTKIGYGTFSGCSSLTSIAIPGSVTEIGWLVFRGCSSLTNITVDAANANYSSLDGVLFNKDQTTLVTCLEGRTGSYTIPSSVTEIGPVAFSGCSSLTSITIPDSVTEIGSGAFKDCSSLTSIQVNPEGETYASIDGALFDKALTTLIRYPPGREGAYTIPALVTDIVGQDCDSSGCAGAFEGCSGLTSVTIPKKVAFLGYDVFSGCSALTSIRVEPDNQNFSSVGGVLFDATKTVILRYPEGKEGAYAIPENVSIGSRYWVGFPQNSLLGVSAFENCTGLTGVIIPNTVDHIPSYAFHGCSALASITIPEGVTEIGDSAFSYCSELTAIHVETGNENYSSVEGVLFNATQTTLIRCPEGKSGAYIIPRSVTEITVYWQGSWFHSGENAFDNCRVLTSVTFPKSFTNFSNSGFAQSDAFSGCANLERAIFLGVAPHFGAGFQDAAPDFTIHYLSGSAGFTSPTWRGNPATKIDDGPVLEADNLSISFLAEIPGITLTPETSTDLRNWETEGVTLSEIGDDNRRTASVNRDAPERYLRLVVGEE